MPQRCAVCRAGRRSQRKPVEAVAKEADRRRQECHRSKRRNKRPDRRADRHRGEQTDADCEQAHHGGRERQAREHDSTTSCGERVSHGCFERVAGTQLLSHARHDKEGVINAEAEGQYRGGVRHEDAESGAVSDQEQQRERHENRDACEDYWQCRGDQRQERDEQNDECRRESYGLGMCEVAPSDHRVTLGERRPAEQVHVDTRC